MVEVDQHPDVIAARDGKETKLVAVGRDAPWPSAEIIGSCHPAPVQLADGRWVGTTAREVVVIHGTARRSIPLDPEWEPISSVCVTPRADRILVTMRVRGRGHVVEHALDGSGEWRTVATAYDPDTPSHLYGWRENIYGVDYAGTDHVVMRVAATTSELVLLRRQADGWTEVARTKVSGHGPVYFGGIVTLRLDNRIQVFGVVGDTLVKVRCKLEALSMLAHPADTRTHLWGHRGAGRDGHVLVGVEHVLPKKKATSRR